MTKDETLLQEALDALSYNPSEGDEFSAEFKADLTELREGLKSDLIEKLTARLEPKPSILKSYTFTLAIRGTGRDKNEALLDACDGLAEKVREGDRKGSGVKPGYLDDIVFAIKEG